METQVLAKGCVPKIFGPHLFALSSRLPKLFQQLFGRHNSEKRIENRLAVDVECLPVDALRACGRAILKDHGLEVAAEGIHCSVVSTQKLVVIPATAHNVTPLAFSHP